MKKEVTKPCVPRLRFPGFTADWQEKRLGEIAEIVGGGTPDSNNPDYWDGDINWFTPTEIKTKYLSTSVRKITQKGLEQSSAKMLPAGALLLSTRATVGDVEIAKNKCATNQGFQSLTVFSGESNEFWYYWILHNKSEFVKRSNGSTFNEINKASVASIPALCPHPEEQAKIAGLLSAIDRRIDLLKRQTAATEACKHALLQQMFV